MHECNFFTPHIIPKARVNHKSQRSQSCGIVFGPFRQLRADFTWDAGNGMAEAGGECMKAMPNHALNGKGPIKAIVHYVHSGQCKLGANLMRNAGTDRHLKQCALLVPFTRQSNRTE